MSEKKTDSARVESSADQNASQPSPAPALSRSQRFRAWLHSVSFQYLAMMLLMGLVLCVLFFVVCTPRKYDLTVGAISHETINATKDVTDELATAERRQAAAAAVEATYRFQEGVKEEVISSLMRAFNELRTVQQYGQTLQGDREEEDDSDLDFSDEEVDYALTLVRGMSFSRYQIETLMMVSSEDFEDMVSTVTTAVSNSLNTTIREGQVNQAIQTILQIVGYKLDVSLTQNILPTVLRTCIRPNMVVDQEATEEARVKAMEAIEPVAYLQGQNIIREGDLITENHLQMLSTLGLLKENTYDYSVYGGALLAIVFALLSLAFCLGLFASDIPRDVRKIAVILLVLLVCMFMVPLCQLLPNAAILPVSLGPVLATVLLGSHAGSALLVPLAVLYCGLYSGANASATDVVLLLVLTLMEGLFAIRFLRRHPQRIRVLLSGLISAVTGIIAAVMMRLMTSSENMNLVNTCLLIGVGGVLSGLLSVALQPVFETVFRLATPSKLLELTNPNQPIMRRLMIEAPGTYHHSIIVANLAEAAAQTIGANPYLSRAGAYYHDIGKLKRPGYFKENQMGENPHENTDPYVSSAILTSHTRDGVQLAQRYRLPPEILDIIRQHHGDTPTMFFYHKALQMANGTHVNIDEFRYDGPKPQTREAAIVMLADTIEAAVRSMKETTPRAIDQFIERLVRGKLEDGQLSDSPISLRDIDQICEAFSGILRGVYHERIEYPVVPHYATQQQPAPQPAVQPAPQPVAQPAAQPETQPAEQPTETSSQPEPQPEKTGESLGTVSTDSSNIEMSQL